MARILSIEIEDENIKIIEGEKNGERIVLYKAICLPIDQGLRDGEITDMDYITGKISGSLRANKIKTKRAIVLVNSSKLIIRTISLPLLKKRSQILSMLEIEVQELLSADLSKYQISYQIADSFTNENKVAYGLYVVYCIPVTLLDQYRDLGEKLGLRLLKVDVTPHSIKSLYTKEADINHRPIDIGDNIVFLKLGGKSLYFFLVKDGFCLLYNIIENIRGSPLPYLLKFIRSYYSVSGEKSIKKVYIYGRGSQGIDDEIKGVLGIESERVSSLSNLDLCEKLSEGDPVSNLNDYFNNILSLLDSDDISLYLIKDKVRNNYWYLAILISFIITSLALLGFLNSQIFMKKKIEGMTAYLNNEDNIKVNSEILNIKLDRDYLDQYLDQAEKLLEEIKDKDSVDTYIIRKINGLKPPKTKVSSIYYDKKGLQLQCISASMEEAILFLSNLQEIQGLARTYMPEIHFRGDGYFSYSLILNLEKGEEDGS